jgi:RNA polymerase sigma-70 factor (ECF subfamily)
VRVSVLAENSGDAEIPAVGEGEGDFAAHAEPYRRELLAHCYRMVGSVDDAEDLVQETLLRAWRGKDGFEGRASLRSWLYRIATNVCLTALARRGRRMLPTGLGPPGTDPLGPVELAPDVDWLQPIPDALVAADDPAETAVRRDGLRLALVASLQFLPPRQRAVLLLRDVLAFRAAEVATALDMSVAAVKSALQRARATVAKLSPEQVSPPPAEARAVLDEYVKAFENSDAAALERLLTEDAVLEMAGVRTWFAGRSTCMPHLVANALESPGDWRMTPVGVNGQPGVVAYLHGEPYAVVVLGVTGRRLSRITLFAEPAVLARFT